MSKDYFKVNPKNLLDLNTGSIPIIVDRLNKGIPVLIEPNLWEGNPNKGKAESAEPNAEDDECQCPVCSAKRATIKKFASNAGTPGTYSKAQLEEFFVSGNLPKTVSEYFESCLEDQFTTAIDDLIGDSISAIDKSRLIHISEFEDLPQIPRYETKPLVIAYHTSRKIPKDYVVISKAPAIIKRLKSDVPDYMMIGNLDKEVATNLKNSTESYRYNQAVIAKLGNRAMGGSSDESIGISDLIKFILDL